MQFTSIAAQAITFGECKGASANHEGSNCSSRQNYRYVCLHHHAHFLKKNFHPQNSVPVVLLKTTSAYLGLQKEVADEVEAGSGYSLRDFKIRKTCWAYINVNGNTLNCLIKCIT